MMKISDKLNDYLKTHFGSTIQQLSGIGGGCISETFRLELENGFSLFLKQNRYSLFDMFEKEARGLDLLANATNELHIPEVHGLIGDESSGQAFLILSFIEESRPHKSFDEFFGHALARLHQNVATKYGLDHNNYIGRLPQNNEWRNNWITFFIECRLEPQLAMAINHGYYPSASIRQAFSHLCNSLPDILPEEPPSLLHGDLWSGNFMIDQENRPVLIDPAVYYGNREAEISFTRLFGGFGHGFYRAYEELWPLEPGFSERIDLYNLYPLLVHVNLFGGSYISQAEHIIRHH
ncbi:MAG: fructosamine kinase family protein [Balneolales bacterium]